MSPNSLAKRSEIPRSWPSAPAPRPTGLRLWAIAAVALVARTEVGASAGELSRFPAASESQPWRGIVKSIHTAALSTDLMTPIAAIGAREGERVKKGDLLIELDCRRQQHELKALAAIVRETRVAVDTNAHLAKSGASNRSDVEIASARHEKASAEWAALQQRLSGCRIGAPFDGTVVELSANAHELPPANKPLMTFTSTDRIEIEIIVPSRHLARLVAGAQIGFEIDETGGRFPAVVLRSAAAVDPVSQTAKIYATFVMPQPPVLPGMSGKAHAIDKVD